MAARKTRLAIVGASARAAAESAVRGGFDVVAADLFADADLRAVCPAAKIDEYPHGLGDWLADQDVDAWMYTGALENSPDLVDDMAAIRPLLGVSGEALRRSRDPLGLQQAFRNAGAAFPETLPISQPPPGGGGWLAKTYRHSAGVGVWLYGEHPLHEAVHAQRFVEGDPWSAVFALGSERAALLCVTEQLLEGGRDVKRGFGYRGTVGPIAVTAAQKKRLRCVGDALLEPLGLRGVVGVDCVVCGDEVTVVEVNPRWPASLEVAERAGKRSAMMEHIACFGGTQPKSWRVRNWTPRGGGAPTCGKRVVFAESDATVSRDFADWAIEEHEAIRMADLPSEGQTILAGRPVCTVLAMGMSPQPVRSALRERAAEVTRRLEAGG